MRSMQLALASCLLSLALALPGCGGGEGSKGPDSGACDPACSGVTPYCDATHQRCVACRDDKDCGAGNRCGTRNGEPACVAACTTAVDCPPGSACCDWSCVDVQSDTGNCGACGSACPVPTNGKASCEAGQCGLDSCNAGYKDCDQDVSNGCEAHTDSDSQNCGACGQVCEFANASGTCGGGSCALASCDAPFASCDGNDTNGCEVDLQTDKNHCGDCGTACGDGQGCSNGACVDAGPVVLAAAQNGPGEIVVDDDSVYWVNYANGTTYGSVAKVSKNGGVPVTLASGQSLPSGIAVDQNAVYWGIGLNVDGLVMKTGLSGGSLVTLAAGQAAPSGIAVDGSYVYWVNYFGGTVMKVALGGGTPVTLATEQTYPERIALDRGSVYWSSGAISKIAKSGGSPTVLASGQATRTRMALDDSAVYWTNVASGTVLKVSLSGGTPVTLVSGQNKPAGIAVDGSAIYWVSLGDGTLNKVSKSGGSPTVLLSGQASPVGITVDDGFVYWTNDGSGGDDGTIMKMAK